MRNVIGVAAYSWMTGCYMLLCCFYEMFHYDAVIAFEMTFCDIIDVHSW